MSDLLLTQINVFPIKSLGGISLTQSVITDRGLKLDRRWMLVDPDGQFLTQREHPKMSLLNVTLRPDRLCVQHVQFPQQTVEVPFDKMTDLKTTVSIWKSRCLASVCSIEVNAWFGEQLGIECRLVYMPNESRRRVDKRFQRQDEIVSFADGFPCLIIGEASLDDLNGRLKRPVAMDRFRTNLVFSGGPAYCEDEWRVIRIGDVVFRVVKPCPRCVMTTIDPKTAARGVEPLRTLATYRRSDNGGVMFGQNLIHDGQGELSVGMPIEVLE